MSATVTASDGATTNTGGGAGTGSGNGSGSGSGSTNTGGGAGTGPKGSTARAMLAHARREPIGRAALALIWLGLLVGTSGIWQLQTELRRHPLAA